MQGKKKAPVGATIQVKHKGSDLMSNPQPGAPCTACPKWNACGRLLWHDCLRFGVFILQSKEHRWTEKRRAKECR